MADEDPARAVVDLITGAWRAQALYAAVCLGIPDHVADGHDDDAALAAATGAGQDGIGRLMRLLTALRVFETGPSGGYRTTAVSALLRDGAAESMRDMILIYGEEFHRAWGSVVPAIRTGTSGFAHAFGTPLREYLKEEPGAGAKFQRAMNAGNVFFPDVAKAFDFSACRTVVDVAGGSGTLLSTVLRQYPGVHGVLFDLPHTAPLAREHLDRTVGADRHEVVSGDAFAAVPEGADAYLLSRVLQDWDDEQAGKLLATIRRAMPPTARLLLVERVVPVDGSAVLPLLYDLHLLMAAGGRERTLDGYRSVLSGAGLRLESVHSLALETSLLVAAPA